MLPERLWSGQVNRPPTSTTSPVLRRVPILPCAPGYCSSTGVPHDLPGVYIATIRHNAVCQQQADFSWRQGREHQSPQMPATQES